MNWLVRGCMLCVVVKLLNGRWGFELMFSTPMLSATHAALFPCKAPAVQTKQLSRIGHTATTNFCVHLQPSSTVRLLCSSQIRPSLPSSKL